MQSSEKIKVRDLNNLLTCVLCKGYYIDATTIIECLHSFCRTCIVRYLQTNKYCPTCEVQVHKTRPLVNIRSDQTLQDIVYKLVPGLFKNEMKRRRDFYSQKSIAPAYIPSSSEKRGDVWGCDRLIFTPDDVISVSLEYYPLIEPLPLKLQTNVYPLESLCTNGSLKNESHRRYFRCPGALMVYHLKKLLCAKHNFQQSKKIDILYMHDYLKDQYTLVDLAYIYSWKRSEPLRLFYKIAQGSLKNCTNNFQPADIENDNKCIILPVEPQNASTCSAILLDSPNPSMAMAPSSRHSSRPPSPQMAEEPKEIKLENPNCAAMQSQHNIGNQDHLVSEPKLKGVLKKSIHNPDLCDIPEFHHAQSLKRNRMDLRAMPDHTANNRTTESCLPSINDCREKKRVTFSVDLDQNCYHDISFTQKLPKYNSRSLVRLKSVNGSRLRNVIQMRSRVLSNKSS